MNTRIFGDFKIRNCIYKVGEAHLYLRSLNYSLKLDESLTFQHFFWVFFQWPLVEQEGNGIKEKQIDGLYPIAIAHVLF